MGWKIICDRDDETVVFMFKTNDLLEAIQGFRIRNPWSASNNDYSLRVVFYDDNRRYYLRYYDSYINTYDLVWVWAGSMDELDAIENGFHEIPYEEMHDLCEMEGFRREYGNNRSYAPEMVLPYKYFDKEIDVPMREVEEYVLDESRP